jgi:hypothetical protein
LFRESDLQKSPAFGAFVCWRWRVGAGDNVAQLVAAGHLRAALRGCACRGFGDGLARIVLGAICPGAQIAS